jgi:peptidyl-prolyl cis-trans isomerase C
MGVPKPSLKVKMMSTGKRLQNAVLILVLLGGAAGAAAQALVTRDGLSVTADDLMVGMARKPNEPAQASPYAKPEAVKITASNMLVRRSLAQDAVKEGLDKDPAVQAALAQARDRVLSDAKLARLDEANKPTAAMVESYARTVYNANPQRFEATEQVRVRHVLIRKETEGGKGKTEALLKELKAGADFESIAKAQSDDKGSGARGGDLGWAGRGRMVKPFEDASFALQTPGQLSDVVETQFGFHIIQLVEKKAAGPRSFDEVKAGLLRETEAALVNEGRNKEQARILSEAKFDEAAIEAFSKSQR